MSFHIYWRLDVTRIPVIRFDLKAQLLLAGS